jgi:ABC-type lipoprotein release transport system permease subunit
MFAAWSPVAFRLRHDRRLRSASLGLIVFVIAVAAGVTMAAVAGARRSDSAYGRLLRWGRDPQTTFSGCVCSTSQLHREFDRIRGAPSVIDSEAVGFADVIPELPDGSRPSFLALQPIVARDRRLAREFPRVKMLHGRLVNVGVADEAIIGFLAATRFHLHVGDSISLIDSKDNRNRVATVRIVGIYVAPGEFPTANGPQSSSLILSPAFARAFPRVVNEVNDSLLVRFRPGTPAADVARLTSSLRYDLVSYPSTSRENGAARTIRVETVALLALALVVALVGFVLVALMLRQRGDATEDELAKLRALGWDRAASYRLAALDGVLIGGVGALASLVLATALSPLFPVGLGRLADVDVGWHVDLPVLAIGTATTLLCVCALRILTSRRASATAGTVVRTFGRPAPTTHPGVLIGLYLGRTQQGRRRGTNLWSLVSLVVVVAALVAVLLAIASFDQLVRHPELSGATWNAVVLPPTDAKGARHTDRALAVVRRVPGVATASRGGWAGPGGGNIGSLIVNGHPVDGQIFADDGLIRPAIRYGRAPTRAGEIALGAKTMHVLRVHRGATVELGAKKGGPTIRGVVVGEVVLVSPLFADFTPGTGAATTAATLRRLGTPNAVSTPFVFVRYRPQASPLHTFDAIESSLGTTEAFEAADRSTPTGLHRIRTIPLLLIAGLFILLAAALGHSLFVSIRDRRRDFSVLTAIGMSRRQTREAVLLHGTLTASIVYALGIPLGVVVGSIAWSRIADNLVVVVHTSIPVAQLLLLALLLLAIADLAALLPRAVASRRTPASYLRAQD